MSSSSETIKRLEDRIARLESLIQAQTHAKHPDRPTLPPTKKLDCDVQNGGEEHISRPIVPLSIPMPATRIVMHQIVQAADTDALGICSGGQVLSWIDICAGLSARQAAHGAVVTASLDSVHFVRPCRSGWLAIVAGMVNRTFSSSMEVGVRVEAEDMKTGVREHCCSAYLTFVSLKAREDPANHKLPQIVPVSNYEHRIRREANQRRLDRLQKREMLKSHPELAAQEKLARLMPVHEEGGPTLPPAVRLGDVENKVLKEIEPGLTTAHMTQLIMPHHANTLGITFGGQVMCWMEQCAAISASRLRGGHLLTASIDSLTFARSTKVGHIMYIIAQVTAVFTTSMEVMVTVYGEDPVVGTTFHCADAFVTVVCVNGEEEPVVIPCGVKPETEAEVVRYEGAQLRRVARLELKEKLLIDLKRKPSLDGRIMGDLADGGGSYVGRGN